MPISARVLIKDETVSLRDAKAKLSNLTKQARAGARVVITNHGTPIADLVQHGTGVVPVRQFKRPGPLPKPIRLKGEGPTASERVLLDRAS
jgi:prevent-host-death family protein